jgi:hypothetical protein
LNNNCQMFGFAITMAIRAGIKISSKATSVRQAVTGPISKDGVVMTSEFQMAGQAAIVPRIAAGA